MKMLTRDEDKNYLISLKERLEDNGIPAVIQGDNVSRMIVPSFLLEPTLWIYIDEQFDDAVKLMDNPDHVVTSGIDMESFQKNVLSESAQKDALNKGLIQLALYTGAIMLGMYIFIKVLNRLSA